MPRKSGSIPSYSHHRRSEQAVVRIGGFDHYLGPYDSTESHEKYDRLIAERLSNGRPSIAAAPVVENGLLVNELLLKFIDFAEQYYVIDGKLLNEVANLKLALRPVKNLYGSTFCHDVGPNSLKAIRQHMVEIQKLSRKEVNKRIGRVKRVFKWAVSEELVPPFVFEGLRTVEGLRRGRTSARENPAVKPVEDAVIEATLPFLSPQVAAMIRLQRATWDRSGKRHQFRSDGGSHLEGRYCGVLPSFLSNQISKVVSFASFSSSFFLSPEFPSWESFVLLPLRWRF